MITENMTEALFEEIDSTIQSLNTKIHSVIGFENDKGLYEMYCDLKSQRLKLSEALLKVSTTIEGIELFLRNNEYKAKYFHEDVVIRCSSREQFDEVLTAINRPLSNEIENCLYNYGDMVVGGLCYRLTDGGMTTGVHAQVDGFTIYPASKFLADHKLFIEQENK